MRIFVCPHAPALEDLDCDEIRERARRLRLAVPPGRRLAISIHIWTGLFRSPSVDPIVMNG